MSKAQEQEVYRRITAMKDPEAITRELANATRIQGITETIPRGEPVVAHWDNNLWWETHYLKPDYFLALFYDKTKVKDPDPYTEQGLKDCQAWIFRYIKSHSQFSIEARNSEIGNRSFSQLAHRLATD
ncbi:unnamed protein product [marine sediment metagenome]|uniref:Uncharacterized protein n=1 Tax=marine sediment metagenome TaxID=412755 RepID=X1R291_9ZZZZ